MGNAASELQHIANQVQGIGPQEKQFITAVFEGKVSEATDLLGENPNLIYSRTKDWYSGWHLAARAGNMQVCCDGTIVFHCVYGQLHVSH